MGFLGRAARDIAIARWLKGDLDTSGTLGGFVRLESPSFPHPKLCATTCHHVAREDVKNADVFDSSFLNILPMKQPGASSIVMQSPSEADLRSSLREHQMNLDSMKSQKKELEELRETQDGFLIPRNEKQLDRFEAKLPSLEKKVALTQARSEPIGKVIACSGVRKSDEGHKLDWALVEVEKDRFSNNFPPSRDDLPLLIRSSPLADNYRPHGPTFQVEPMKLGGFVTMRGRTTGYSGGVVHRIKEDINNWQKEGLITQECIIIGIEGPSQSSRRRSKPIFSRPGDSGAWIFNENGSVVGQQIAHLVVKGDWEFEETVATPMATVFKDMESLTGAKLVLPEEE